jgi:hypothetical protein
VSVGLGGDGDELAWADWHLVLIDDDYAVTANDCICILSAVLDVVMAHGGFPSGKLHLIQPEGADSERLTDPLVVGACCRVRPRGSFDVSSMEMTESDAARLYR